ncbi:hypothetical protein QDT91_28665 (plasmid) [Mycolicibacterium aubagnense]|jgi:hypothetical protein|uniref:hypothetical protein n=1 Tax=Mycolicibacterium aubagnense TaxID=319707 RepID=UPI00244DECEA|nr:hypothetical protein [Mycolicibacterium aubagnense]WGI35981.1 hypothetical protein QDT91_28665 [Mycolicibacterium aubagnense]
MFVAKWYTRATRVRIVIAKFDGRWTLPGGPYPIPELLALASGILLTLYLLPRTGHAIITAAIGLGATAVMVTVMRKMPYSPVPFLTRVQRISRLYSAPVSVTGVDDLRAQAAVSVVRADVEILDDLIDDAAPHQAHFPNATTAHPEMTLAGLFDHQSGPAADLFG